MKGVMEIMDVTAGDIKVEWNPDQKDEVDAAKKQFKELQGKGFKAFRIYDGGKKGEELDSFDKYAERILFVPPIVGG
jgi:hypothetical protein